MLATALSHLRAGVEAVHQRYRTVNGLTVDDAWYLLKLGEEVGELTRAFVRLRDRALSGEERQRWRDNLAEELADVFCHVVLLAARHDVDLASAVEKKWLSRLAPAS
jgi:NTP pyrophosphatase (non-canonical NTP hydrolase)